MRRTIPAAALATLCMLSCSSSGGPGANPPDSGGAGGHGGSRGSGGASGAGGTHGAGGSGGSAGSGRDASPGKDGGGGTMGEAGKPPPDVDASGIPMPAGTCTPPITAVDTTKPTTTVGTGTAASCTEAALTSALTTGGIVTFDCGVAPATITVTKTIELPVTKNIVIDGGGKVTIDGGGSVRILDWNSSNYRKNMFSLTLQNITFAHGHATGTMAYASAPAPCSTGYYDGAGGALQMRDGVLHVINAIFLDNEAEKLGPDVGGGAIYLNGALGAVVTGSTFLNNSGSNAGAIGSLNSDLDVYNSNVQGNAALGFGANGNDMSMCGVKATNGQYQTGSGGNGGAIAIDGGSDVTHTFCGVTFKGNMGGMKALGGAIFRTPDGAQQTTTIDRCLFDSNTGDSAGAAYFHNSALTITASTFTGNIGQGTGTIQADGTKFDFTNVTFYGNHSSAGVGATLSLFNASGTPGGSLLNCTLANNVCDASGMFAAAIFGSPDLTIQNTIFDDDTAMNPGAPMQCQVGRSRGRATSSGPWTTRAGAAPTRCARPASTRDPIRCSARSAATAVPSPRPSPRRRAPRRSEGRVVRRRTRAACRGARGRARRGRSKDRAEASGGREAP